MNKYAAGLIGGLVAAVVQSAIMLMKSGMGLMPQLDVIAMLSTMMGTTTAVAWIAHFMIGAVWGVSFAALASKIPTGPSWVRGMVFLIAPWLAMMVVVMPMAGAGLFGMNMGIMAPIVTLVLHLIFGAVMGFTYAKLARPDDIAWSGHARHA